MEKVKELKYTQQELKAIREKDPSLTTMTTQWELAFKSQVRVTKEGGQLVVRSVSHK